MGCSILDPLGCLSSAAQSVAGDAFDSIAKDFGNVADSAINWLWGQISSATAVQLGGAGFDADLKIVVAITATVAVGLFVIQVIGSTLRRDPGGLGRAFKGLLVAFLGGGAAIGVTNLLLGAVDALSAGVVQQAMGTNIAGMGKVVLATGVISSVGNPAGIMLLAFAALAAVVIVWAALMVRKVLIIVSAVFAPLAFAGSLADITVAWTRRWIEVTVALIFSKLILVIIFVVGWSVLEGGAGRAGGGVTQSVTQVVAGVLILAVAGFAPWMALKLVHFSGDHFHQLHALGSSMTAGTQQALRAPQKVQSWQSAARSMQGGSGGSPMQPPANGSQQPDPGASGSAPSNFTAAGSGPVGAAGSPGTPGASASSSPRGGSANAGAEGGSGVANPPSPPPPGPSAGPSASPRPAGPGGGAAGPGPGAGAAAAPPVV